MTSIAQVYFRFISCFFQVLSSGFFQVFFRFLAIFLFFQWLWPKAACGTHNVSVDTVDDCGVGRVLGCDHYHCQMIVFIGRYMIVYWSFYYIINYHNICNVYIYIYICIRVYVYIYIDYRCMYMCTYIYIYKYKYTYIYIYIV